MTVTVTARDDDTDLSELAYSGTVGDFESCTDITALQTALTCPSYSGLLLGCGLDAYKWRNWKLHFVSDHVEPLLAPYQGENGDLKKSRTHRVPPKIGSVSGLPIRVVGRDAAGAAWRHSDNRVSSARRGRSATCEVGCP
jgi:hypothetical protein